MILPIYGYKYYNLITFNIYINKTFLNTNFLYQLLLEIKSQLILIFKRNNHQGFLKVSFKIIKEFEYENQKNHIKI